MLRLLLLLNLIFLTSQAFAEDLATLSSESLDFSLEVEEDSDDVSVYKLFIKPKAKYNDISLTANVFPVKNPSRLVIDIPEFPAGPQKTEEVNSGIIAALRLGAHESKTRLVIDLKTDVLPDYDISADEESGRLVARFSVKSSAKIVEPEDTIIPVAKPTPLVIPTPIPTPKVKETPKPTPIPSIKIPSTTPKDKGDFNTVSTNSTIVITPAARLTPESFVMRGNEQVDTPPAKLIPEKFATNASAIINNILFQAPKDAPLGAIVIEGEKITDYRLDQKGKNLYELTLKNAKLSGDHLTLPQFPPATFKGFEVILANQEASGVLLKVYVNEGVKIKSFNAKGKLWLKAEK